MLKDIDYGIKENEDIVWKVIWKHYPKYAKDEDFFQVGLIALWKGLKTYDKNVEGTKFNYLYTCVFNGLSVEVTSRNREKRRADQEATSLDYVYENIKSNEMRSTNPNNLMQFQRCDEYAYIDKDVAKKLTSNQLKVFQYFVNGYNGKEIAKILNCSKQRVSEIKKKIMPKIIDYIVVV